MTELRIIPDVLPIAPVVFTDAGYYWRGRASCANEIFEVFHNMNEVKNSEKSIVAAIDKRLKEIEADFLATPTLGVIFEDDEEKNDIKDIDTKTLVKIWKEIYKYSLNDDNEIDADSHYDMINHSMQFYSDWEKNFITAVDDTFDMLSENGTDIPDETVDFYFIKTKKDMSAEFIEKFAKFITDSYMTKITPVPFRFYDLNIDARNFMERQEERIKHNYNENGEEIITDLRELNPRPTQVQPILRVLRPE